MKTVLLWTAAISLAAGNAAYAADKEKNADKAKEKQEIVLEVYGVECAGCARVLTAALKEGGVEKSSRLAPSRGEESVRIEAEMEGEADLSKVAAAVNEANTPHRGKSPPGLALVLFSEVDEESAEKLNEALAEVKGVEAEEAQIDTEKGEIHLKLSGEEEVTVGEIVEALQTAGIQARTSKEEA